MPVFTAHPTEAKRRTLLTKLGRVAETLHAFDFHSPTPDEARAATLSLREEIVSLWQTDDTRTYRPSVLDGDHRLGIGFRHLRRVAEAS